MLPESKVMTLIADDLKDQRLADLAADGNVARFVSFGPGELVQPRYSCLSDARVRFSKFNLEDAIRELFTTSGGSVNVRSFLPHRGKGNPFIYGLSSAGDAISCVRNLASQGFYTIVNETIDVDDGGVSGVSSGGIVEFAPGETPRTVEQAGAASLPVDIAEFILSMIYGSELQLPAAPNRRFEFSVHPEPVGSKKERLLLWEVERVAPIELQASIMWPNKFSRFIGDKTFGLLVASALGFDVPQTTVLARRVRPFSFGHSTGSGNVWTRTAPALQDPGRFTTARGYVDPFKLLALEDSDNSSIASVLIQDAVVAEFSGASLPGGPSAADVVEGVVGDGDDFMLGERRPNVLPAHIVDDVRQLLSQLRKRLGQVRVEWAHDGALVWIVQLHVGAQQYTEGVLSPGTPKGWLTYDPDDGLESLRALISHARLEQLGILISRPVGITSHVGDLLRQAEVPARLA
jgi:hypothetical protein